MVKTCPECFSPLPVTARSDARTCSTKCRVRLHRRHAGKAIPEWITTEARWTRRDGKRPIQPNGFPASSILPATWGTLDNVRDGAGDGYGIMLGGGIGCIDLDDCIDDKGRLVPWAAKMVRQHRGEAFWMERSMSGRGVHIFLPLPEGPGRRTRKNGESIEVYSRARFIAVTQDFI